MCNETTEQKLRGIIVRAASAQWPMLKKQEKQAALADIERIARELLREMGDTNAPR